MTTTATTSDVVAELDRDQNCTGDGPCLKAPVLEHLGGMTLRAGDHGRARGHWEQALNLYTRTGDPKADRVRSLLRELTGLSMPPDQATR